MKRRLKVQEAGREADITMSELVSLAALMLLLVTTTSGGGAFNYLHPEENQKDEAYEHYLYNFTLPSDFRIGVASAAYQYEGAWNEGGKFFV
jgi:hypothetical protein